MRGKRCRWLLDWQVEERLLKLLRRHVHIFPYARREPNVARDLAFLGLEAALEVGYSRTIQKRPNGSTRSLRKRANDVQ